MNMTGHHVPSRNITAILNVAASLILIPPYGMTGAAAAATLSLIFLNVITLLHIHRNHGSHVGYFPVVGV